MGQQPAEMIQTGASVGVQVGIHPADNLTELYDLERDPYELNNLAGQPGVKEVESKLKIALADWMVAEGDFLPIPSLKYPEEDPRVYPDPSASAAKEGRQ